VWWWNQQTRPKSLSNRQLPFARIAIPGGVAAAPVPALPKGNRNALKHGRNSRRQAQLVEALMQVPETRDTLIALGKRNRRLRRQAEEGAGVLMTRLLENVARITLNQACPEHGRRGDNQDQNNQEFLDFLNTATAQMRILLEKQSRLRRTPIKPVLSRPRGRVEGRPPLSDA